jgi:hypothetical protein
VVLSVAAEAISRINSCEGHSLSVACCMLHQGCVQSSKKLAGLSTESTDPPDSRQKVFFPPHNIICWNTWVTCITRGSFEFPIGFWYFKSNQVVSKSLLSSCKQSFSSGQLYKHHKKLTGSRCSQIWSEKKKYLLKKNTIQSQNGREMCLVFFYFEGRHSFFVFKKIALNVN